MPTVSLKTFFHPRYWYAWPVLALMCVWGWLPGRVLWVLGNALGALFSMFPSPARGVAARNLELCFPDMEPRERRRLIKRHFRLTGFAVVSLSVAWWAPKWRVKRFITLRDQHFLEEVLAGGKNSILLVPHFIGLDVGAMRLSMDRNYVSMYRRSRNDFLEYLFQRRSRFGALVVERASSLKTLIRLIRQGVPFYYLPDQDLGERSSVFVPFFGVPAATVTALSRIAQSTDAAVIPCIMRILPRGRGYEVRFYPPLENFPSDDPKADALYMNQQIEKWVREMPEQYLWSYRRFKTRPNNEPSLYNKK
jgi:KDO2-lipid IV(A) lauroyltransferase